MNKYILTDGNFLLLSQTLGCERINLVDPFFFNVTVITRGLGSLENTLMVRGDGKCFICLGYDTALNCPAQPSLLLKNPQVFNVH